MAKQAYLHSGQTLVQIASYNTNLQGVLGLPQDLVDWLAPTLQVSNFLSPERRAPDIVAVGFQELLPLHLGLSGFSKAVINDRDTLILSQIETHAPNKESYSLIAKVVNVGVALLVYGRDDGIARKVSNVHTSWTGCGPAYMGNKGAVGVRFRVAGPDGTAGETYTFVNCHLTAHQHKLQNRIADYKHIVSTLLFPPEALSTSPSTLYETSHLFLLGDLNFRIELPKTHPLYAKRLTHEFAQTLESEKIREELKEYDQLTIEKRKGTIFAGLHEGDFWKFKCSYKYKLGEVDKYSIKRTPSWTDRILYATYTDSLNLPNNSSITNLLYTSIPSYTTSDHKPIVSLLLLPPRPEDAPPSIPTIPLPATYSPTADPKATLKRYTGRSLDRVIGITWWIITLLGAGSGIVGVFNLFLGLSAWMWLKIKPSAREVQV
ncbi:Type II inositol 1,4,5-trisphosphate 5-phosphatase [Psilocybe cubensis]|uniref:Type II inositol 1,4,5-trisphosphate 5-phosphatase n=2 Tax=Psilocybe cubensis TaxID=181762 RepID=A0ACB8H7R3_PSICU|nr:Type II inositol 1,4,5-trisphosphate 5-phosphatase [Psilocybe cubensis]KAH9483968.1 Type II inositol 1,4,5-trisphosphate 5-phosphatase [Psilocybe cubensis]